MVQQRQSDGVELVERHAMPALAHLAVRIQLNYGVANNGGVGFLGAILPRPDGGQTGRVELLTNYSAAETC